MIRAISRIGFFVSISTICVIHAIKNVKSLCCANKLFFLVSFFFCHYLDFTITDCHISIVKAIRRVCVYFCSNTNCQRKAIENKKQFSLFSQWEIQRAAHFLSLQKKLKWQENRLYTQQYFCSTNAHKCRYLRHSLLLNEH